MKFKVAGLTVFVLEFYSAEDADVAVQGVFRSLQRAQKAVPGLTWHELPKAEVEFPVESMQGAWWALDDETDEYGAGWSISEWVVQ